MKNLIILKRINVITFLFLISFFISENKASAQKTFPTNFGSVQLDSAKSNIDAWDGKTIAFDVTIWQVEKINKRTLLRVNLDSAHSLWIAPMIMNDVVKKGAKFRMLGFFTKKGKNDPSEKVNENGFIVIVFAMIDLETSQLFKLPGLTTQIQEWQSGKVPVTEN